MNRRQFTRKTISGILSFSLFPSLLAKDDAKIKSEDIEWYNVEDWGIEGKGWSNTTRYFDRLPSKAKGRVREVVWDLSRHSAGMCVHFESDSPDLYVKYELLSDRLAMSHMPATGVSGLDLYGMNNQGLMRWVSVVRPNSQTVEAPIAKGIREGKRTYRLYLPLYNGVERLEIGVPKGGVFESISPRSEKSMVFYGTSIMHGACASRPGMAIPAILGRRFRRPTINLGFSGNGRMEPEVGEILSELDPCVFAIDCLPNMNQETISERAVPLVQQLRKAHPKTPILLVEDRSYTSTPFFPSRQERHRTNREALKEAHRKLLDQGIEHLYYLDGDLLLGLDGEAATDGSHPNDLGMVRYADAYEPALRAILKQY